MVYKRTERLWNLQFRMEATRQKQSKAIPDKYRMSVDWDTFCSKIVYASASESNADCLSSFEGFFYHRYRSFWEWFWEWICEENDLKYIVLKICEFVACYVLFCFFYSAGKCRVTPLISIGSYKFFQFVEMFFIVFLWFVLTIVKGLKHPSSIFFN